MLDVSTVKRALEAQQEELANKGDDGKGLVELPTASFVNPGLALRADVPSAPPGRDAQTPPTHLPGPHAPGAPQTSAHQLALPLCPASRQPTTLVVLSSAPRSFASRLMGGVTGTVAWRLPSTQVRDERWVEIMDGFEDY